MIARLTSGDDAGVPVEMASLVEQLHRRARLMYGDEAGEMSAIRLYEDAVGVSLRARSAAPVKPATTSPDS